MALEVNSREVTLYYKACSYTRFDGTRQKRFEINRMAKITYNDGSIGYVPIDVDISDGPTDPTFGSVTTNIFFMESDDTVDQGDGAKFHEILANGDV